MGLLFDPREVFQIAIRIEENGEKFYRELAGRLEDPEVTGLFAFLAEEEVGHRRFYQGLLDKCEPFEIEEGHESEYMEYLRSYAEGIIFNQEAFEKKLREVRDAAAAIEFAIGVEWDSIHYYQELKGMVPENKRAELDALIGEERKHFVQLGKIKKEKNY